MNVTLRLRCDGTRRRTPTAWFIVGRSPDHWLAELARWAVPLADASVFPLPTSMIDRTPCGLLVVGAGPSDGQPTPASIPYAVVAKELYVPVDARFEPDLRDHEISPLLEGACVWLPHVGLVALSSASRVTDLIALPTIVAHRWTLAVPGTAVNAKLVSVQLDDIPSAEQVLAAARDDIASQPLTLDTLPPVMGEPRPGVTGHLGRSLDRGLAMFVLWLARNAPAVASEPTWLNRLEDWATHRLRQLAGSIDIARNRELHRLIDLLHNDPDEGLRFAIPMGAGDHRGMAPPSTILPRRDIDFSLGGLRQGGSADFWGLPTDFQSRLIERYRTLAAREIGLGRHRRAAYIFSTLLNDVQSAAQALEDGGHFREAAVLYEERLARLDLAAHCFRKGRCWPEAIALYERLHDHETLGELYAELERPEEAVLEWRRAIDQHLKADDVQHAARLLEQKLGCIDEAFEHLVAAWPGSKQAQTCLTAAFTLASLHQRHTAAHRLVALSAERVRDPRDAVALIDVLVVQACTYPSPEVQSRAADQTRLLVAERLATNLSEDETRRLMLAVRRLVPEDRLLARDGHRYLAKRRLVSATASPRKPSSRPLSVGPASPIVEIQLPSLEWHTAVTSGEALFAAGYRDRECVVVRTDWHGATPDEPIGLKWNAASHAGRPVVLAADPLAPGGVIVHSLHGQPLPHPRTFGATDHFPSSVVVGSHRGLCDETVGIACGDGGTSYVVNYQNSGDGPVLVANAYLGKDCRFLNVATLRLADLPVDVGDLTLPLPMAAQEGRLVLGIGCNLCVVRHGASPRFQETPHAIEQMVVSAPHTRPRLVVAMAQGGFMMWGSGECDPQASFASEMASPRVALSRDGTLIAVSENEVEFSATSEGTLRLQTRWHAFGIKPLAVLAPRHINRFAVLSADGRLVIYDVPPSCR